jgi:hypothetical protein
MKRYNLSPTILVWALILITAHAQEGVWNWQRLPGGNSDEIVQVNEDLGAETYLKGIWLPDKDGGNYWVEFNNSTQSWNFSGIQEFDAYDAYCQGADECWINDPNNGEHPYAISAKYHGTQTYKYGGSSPGAAWSYVTPSVARNLTQRWEDAAFCSDGNNGYNSNYFVLSNVYNWYPNGTTVLHTGLCLSQDGGSPSITPVIDGTQDYWYSKLYRDCTPSKPSGPFWAKS